MISKEIDLLFFKRVAQLGSYGVEILIKVYVKEPIIRRIISVKKITIISLNVIVIVSIYHLDLLDRDFLFESIKNLNLSLYAEMLNKNTTTIPITNSINKPIHIRRNMKLGDLIELAIDEYYHIILR